ncbi:MAG: hypothetical protein LIP08_09220 [Bacteroides sp.]|nr:hypothetical protein [Bacteroides sp.]
MKKKTRIVFFILMALAIHTKAYGTSCCDSIQTEHPSPVEITALDDTFVLQMRYSRDYPWIGIQFYDKHFGMGVGTALEIKRQEDFYVVIVKYDPEPFCTIDEGIEAYLKELFRHSYEEEDKEHGEKVWRAFVEEGGLQIFIDTAKDWIDDEFLDSPFDEIYG